MKKERPFLYSLANLRVIRPKQDSVANHYLPILYDFKQAFGWLVRIGMASSGLYLDLNSFGKGPDLQKSPDPI